ncbi:unnamed protein product [Symbiodinium sp. CCMP2592]|nr:unnamed protein product [Symbiodinium sp. CCMP2592]
MATTYSTLNMRRPAPIPPRMAAGTASALGRFPNASQPMSRVAQQAILPPSHTPTRGHTSVGPSRRTSQERPTTPVGNFHSRRDDFSGPRSSNSGNFDGQLPVPRSLGDGSSRSKSVAVGPGRLTSHREGINSAGSSGSTTCDKCDGKHPTDRCPHFQKDREKHKDAWVNYGCKNNPHQMGGNPGNFVLRNARVVRQPGDGSCLYHSLSYGLGDTDARSLRRELAQFLRDRPSLEIAGDTLEEWVRWDSNSSVETYTSRQSMSGWGGGIEMACCSQLKNVNIHVYESVSRNGCDFKRISCFDAPKQDRFVRTVHVLYQGGLHYDALQPP